LVSQSPPEVAPVATNAISLQQDMPQSPQILQEQAPSTPATLHERPFKRQRHTNQTQQQGGELRDEIVVEPYIDDQDFVQESPSRPQRAACDLRWPSF